MYSRWQLSLKYLRYFFLSSNGKGHGTHSPFIFHFITQVLNDRKLYTEYDQVENLRDQLTRDNTLLTLEDLGAGSSFGKTNKRTIAAIAKGSAKPQKIGQLLFRIVKAYQPQTIVELGTSLGITTSYLSLGKPDARVITMEGAREVAAEAGKNFRQLGIKNIEVKQGNFDAILMPVLAGLDSVDLAFIDGNHRREPTERYFRDLLPKINNDSILIFDDIHWSPEMEQAWETIKAEPRVSCSVDLFFTGLVFFREEFKEKQDFSIRF